MRFQALWSRTQAAISDNPPAGGPLANDAKENASKPFVSCRGFNAAGQAAQRIAVAYTSDASTPPALAAAAWIWEERLAAWIKVSDSFRLVPNRLSHAHLVLPQAGPEGPGTATSAGNLDIWLVVQQPSPAPPAGNYKFAMGVEFTTPGASDAECTGGTDGVDLTAAKSDTNDLPLGPPRYLLCTAAGTLKIRAVDGAAGGLVFAAVAVGQRIDVMARQVFSTGTAATVLGIYS